MNQVHVCLTPREDCVLMKQHTSPGYLQNHVAILETLLENMRELQGSLKQGDAKNIHENLARQERLMADLRLLHQNMRTPLTDYALPTVTPLFEAVAEKNGEQDDDDDKKKLTTLGRKLINLIEELATVNRHNFHLAQHGAWLTGRLIRLISGNVNEEISYTGEGRLQDGEIPRSLWHGRA